MASTPADELKGFDTSKLTTEDDDDSGESRFSPFALRRLWGRSTGFDEPGGIVAIVRARADDRVITSRPRPFCIGTDTETLVGPAVVPETGGGSDSKVKVILGLLKKLVLPFSPAVFVI
jgi:hypothetical protein